MNSSKKDYRKLYLLQDKFLAWWTSLGYPFYLTGGTALGRFYLNHRYSEDLDFFINASPDYKKYILNLQQNIGKQFTTDLQRALFTEDYTRIFIAENDVFLKLEFVNDLEFHCADLHEYAFGLIDNPFNILSNKLTAIIGRDEPKDVYDIIHLALNYSFNWQEAFANAKQKSVINEIEVEQRLFSFPIEWFENIDWNNKPYDFSFYKNSLRKIADDFLLGVDNSLGVNKISIHKATPNKS